MGLTPFSINLIDILTIPFLISFGISYIYIYIYQKIVLIKLTLKESEPKQSSIKKLLLMLKYKTSLTKKDDRNLNYLISPENRKSQIKAIRFSPTVKEIAITLKVDPTSWVSGLSLILFIFLSCQKA